MVVVNKKGEIMRTEPITVSHKLFLDVVKRYNHIRVGVGGGKKPFKYIYFKVSKKEVMEIVRMDQMRVTFSIMYNSRVRSDLQDTLFIHKMRMTLLDEPKKKKS